MASKIKLNRSRVLTKSSQAGAQAVQGTRYSLNCFDPRYPLGYPLKGSDDFAVLRKLCDAENAKCVEQGIPVQFWIVANGRYVYPPEFSAESHPNSQDRNEREICPEGAA